MWLRHPYGVTFLRHGRPGTQQPMQQDSQIRSTAAYPIYNIVILREVPKFPNHKVLQLANRP